MPRRRRGDRERRAPIITAQYHFSRSSSPMFMAIFSRCRRYPPRQGQPLAGLNVIAATRKLDQSPWRINKTQYVIITISVVISINRRQHIISHHGRRQCMASNHSNALQFGSSPDDVQHVGYRPYSSCVRKACFSRGERPRQIRRRKSLGRRCVSPLESSPMLFASSRLHHQGAMVLHEAGIVGILSHSRCLSGLSTPQAWHYSAKATSAAAKHGSSCSQPRRSMTSSQKMLSHTIVI